MAKKEKAAAKNAAKEVATQAPPKTQEKKAPEKVEVISEEENAIIGLSNMLGKKNTLSQDSKVIAANLMQKRYVENADAPQQIVDGANIVIDALLADVIVTEVINGEGIFPLIVRRDENKYLGIQAMLASQGITLPSFKTLPAPTEEQLKNAGTKLLPEEAVVVTVSEKNVSKETIAKKKQELKAEKEEVEFDPTKIKDEAQLKKTLTHIFVKSGTSPAERILKAINFMTAYMNVKAKGDKEEEEKVKNLSKEDILRKVTTVIGSAPFVVHGLMYNPCKITNETKLPVSAFCMVKKMFESSKMFNEQMNEDFIMAVTKILILWSCQTVIEDAEGTINRAKTNLKKYEADKEKNKSAILVENAAIRNAESYLIGYKAVIDCISNINFNIIDDLKEDVNAEDKTSEKFKNARRIVANVVSAYYPELKNADLTETQLHNIQNRAGMIANLFADPLTTSEKYLDINFLEEEKKESEESKN